MKDSSKEHLAVLRFGVKLHPATIVLEISGKGHTTRLKKIRIKEIDKSSCDEVCDLLYKTHPKYFTDNSTDLEQVRRLVEKLKAESLRRNPVSSSNGQQQVKEGTLIFKPMKASELSGDKLLQIDLNTCSDELNRKAKELMDVDFDSKRLKPGDADFVYDKVVEFAPPSENAEWDDDDEDD